MNNEDILMVEKLSSDNRRFLAGSFSRKDDSRIPIPCFLCESFVFYSKNELEKLRTGALPTCLICLNEIAVHLKAKEGSIMAEFVGDIGPGLEELVYARRVSLLPRRSAYGQA